MDNLIRNMTLDDIQTIVSLDRQILGQSLGEETFALEIKENPFNHYYVMEYNDQIIGHIGLWIDAPFAQILNFYVIEEVRSKGFGRYLFESAITICLANHVEVLTLEVRPSNERAKRFYQQFGFEQVAIRENYYADGENAYLYLKNLK